MLSLTRKADYAIVAMAQLARLNDKHLSSRELAETIGLSPAMLTNVLHSLVQHGLVVSMQGARGGYRLARLATQISLAEMIDAIEGPFRLAVCCCDDPTEAEQDCEIEGNCSVKEPIRRVHEGLREFLSGIRLADLLGVETSVALGVSGNA